MDSSQWRWPTASVERCWSQRAAAAFSNGGELPGLPPIPQPQGMLQHGDRGGRRRGWTPRCSPCTAARWKAFQSAIQNCCLARASAVPPSSGALVRRTQTGTEALGSRFCKALLCTLGIVQPGAPPTGDAPQPTVRPSPLPHVTVGTVPHQQDDAALPTPPACRLSSPAESAPPHDLGTGAVCRAPPDPMTQSTSTGAQHLSAGPRGKHVSAQTHTQVVGGRAGGAFVLTQHQRDRPAFLKLLLLELRLRAREGFRALELQGLGRGECTKFILRAGGSECTTFGLHTSDCLGP